MFKDFDKQFENLDKHFERTQKTAIRAAYIIMFVCIVLALAVLAAVGIGGYYVITQMN